jgi:carbon-monoxide dehydrogenase medium subunit
MRAFKVVEARDANHAIALLAEHGKSVRLLAGGTDLLVDFKHAPHAPEVVLDLTRAEDLKGISMTEAGLRIGALATHTDIMRAPIIREKLPALVDAAHTIGAVQTRNLGTLGGNLVTCVPSMDSGPTLVALEARVTVAGPGGRREMALTDFFVGPRKTILKADELLVEIVIPKENVGKPTDFLKFGLRKGQALALVNVASSLWVEPKKNTFVAPRIALGAVAPVVIRAPKAEAYLEGKPITSEAMSEAGRIAADEARPITDFRASAEYRRDLIATLTRRTLENAYARTRKGQQGDPK